MRRRLATFADDWAGPASGSLGGVYLCVNLWRLPKRAFGRGLQRGLFAGRTPIRVLFQQIGNQVGRSAEVRLLKRGHCGGEFQQALFRRKT